MSQISVSHLYNLRVSDLYGEQRLVCKGTRPAPVAIGVRKAPAPQGSPGYIRIDTVHQGDQDGVKGVYHINAVDIVTQWELVASVEQISEAYLLPVPIIGGCARLNSAGVRLCRFSTFRKLLVRQKPGFSLPRFLKFFHFRRRNDCNLSYFAWAERKYPYLTWLPGYVKLHLPKRFARELYRTR